jgi:tetratricopeptide (TPR) repeat protein
MRKTIYILCLMAAPAWAETCPEAPPIQAAMDALVAQVQAAPDEMTARALSAQMWELWLEAPDEYSQNLLDSAMERRRLSDYGMAEEALTSLTQYCPFYAEGWNQRAFVRFLRGNWDGALSDLDKALEFNPRHTGALTGKVLTLINAGRDDEAQPVLREALKLNPWLSERALLRGEEL